MKKLRDGKLNILKELITLEELISGGLDLYNVALDLKKHNIFINNYGDLINFKNLSYSELGDEAYLHSITVGYHIYYFLTDDFYFSNIEVEQVVPDLYEVLEGGEPIYHNETILVY